jgi:hypothetical protein
VAADEEFSSRCTTKTSPRALTVWVYTSGFEYPPKPAELSWVMQGGGGVIVGVGLWANGVRVALGAAPTQTSA